MFTIEAGEVVLRKEIEWDKLMKTVKCPRSVRLLLARQIDRLTHKQQIMLKIGALIGYV